MEKDTELPFWLALVRTPNLGPVTFKALQKMAASPAAMFSIPESELRNAGFRTNLINYLLAPDWSAVEKDLHWLEKDGNYFLAADDPLYPTLLRQISDPPIGLFVKGNPDTLQNFQLAMVGSRNPNPDGRRNARNFAAALVSAGLTITSGLALGIDSESHQGALQAGGRTIAVLGNGLYSIYPKSNRKLAQAIIENGALVSEFPLDYSALPANFPRRNRIISGMSTGVLVVEAAVRSGSLITARLAMEQNREVFAIPGSIHNPMARGCHYLLRDGAKLVEQYQDITDEIGVFAGFVDEINSKEDFHPHITKGLDANAKLLLDNIGYEGVSFDQLVEATGFQTSQVSGLLLDLELQGSVDSLPGGRYMRKF